MGLTGELITPQEAAAAYQREHQELSAQIVFLFRVELSGLRAGHARRRRAILHELPRGIPPARPRAGQLRRLPVTNFMARAEQKLTNLNDQVEAIYNRYGTNAVPDAKTPADAKAKIRDALIRATGAGRRAPAGQ